MTVYLMDGRSLVEQQEQWTANRRFIFLSPSSRASREISRSPCLAHKAPVMQARFSAFMNSYVVIAGTFTYLTSSSVQSSGNITNPTQSFSASQVLLYP